VPRRSSNIQINSVALRDALNVRGVQLTRLADELSVTKQAINGWLASGAMGPRRLADMIDKIDLTPDEVYAITTPLKVEKKYQVFFRTKRNVEVAPTTTYGFLLEKISSKSKGENR
jgi:hypothetical protein